MNPAMGYSTMITHHILKLDNKEACDGSPLSFGGRLFQWQEVDEPDGKKKDTCCMDPSVAYGLLFLIFTAYYGSWCVCFKGRERFIGDPDQINKREAFDQVGLLGPYLRNLFCVPCIFASQGASDGKKACMNHIEIQLCPCCMWADTATQSGYKPEWQAHAIPIAACCFAPLNGYFLWSRADNRMKMMKDSEQKEQGSLGMELALHCCCSGPAIFQDAIVAELVLSHGPPAQQSMGCPIPFLNKEYRVVDEVGMTDRLEVKHCKILRMVPAGSIIVQVLPPKNDPTTGMLRVFAKDVEGQGWITILNNRQKAFLESSGGFFARGTPMGPSDEPEDEP